MPTTLPLNGIICLYVCSRDLHAVHLIRASCMWIAVPLHTVLCYICMFVCMFNVNAFVFHHHIILSCNRVAISSLYLAIANYIIMSKLVYRTGAVSVVECSVMSVCVCVWGVFGNQESVELLLEFYAKFCFYENACWLTTLAWYSFSI